MMAGDERQDSRFALHHATPVVSRLPPATAPMAMFAAAGQQQRKYVGPHALAHSLRHHRAQSNVVEISAANPGLNVVHKHRMPQP
jgi:hypothetical protein